MVFKQNKRAFSDDELSCQLACKHPRQMDYSGHYTSFVDLVPRNDFGQRPRSSGEEAVHKFDREDGHVGHALKELWGAPNVKEVGGSAGSSWVTSTISDKLRLESAFYIPFSAAFFEQERSAITAAQTEELYSSVLEFPPRKLVSIGPDHQVDIPAWAPHTMSSKSTHSVDCNNEDEERLMGSCVISLVDTDLTSSNYEEVGRGKVYCDCPDQGSIRCVRQHVMEAREKLRADVGQEAFLKLGFGDMGEVVSSMWSEEEEQMFHEVAFSNPVSRGKNFWDHLSVVFPSKSNTDLVSYYFNVFMLRKRADQNRLDPLNVDSDNDEWQGSEDGDECGSIEGEEDSAVESPTDQEAVYYNDHTHYQDANEDDDDSSDDNDDGNAGDEDFDSVEMAHMCKTRVSCEESPSSHVQLPCNNGDNLQNGSEDQDVQDDSCTSFESQNDASQSFGSSSMDTRQEICIEVDHKIMHGRCINSGLSDSLDHGFSLGPCESKVWDAGFLSAPNREVDFLPTCHVIEEVFGDEISVNKNEGPSCPGFS